MICNRNQGHCSDRKNSEKITLNENYYNPLTSTYLSVFYLLLKRSHTQSMRLRIVTQTRIQSRAQGNTDLRQKRR
jgi:hypothetical protein